ncbi:MAG: TonB-dependent receptor, partial [Bacteroidaceae bacterium]
MKRKRISRLKLKSISFFILCLSIHFLYIEPSYALNPKTNVTLSGVVKDNTTNELLIGANIYVVELLKGCKTDSDGKYSIRIPNGTYNIKISYIGYKTKEQLLTVNKDMRFTANLESGVKLQEVVISSKKKNENLSKVDMGVQGLSNIEIQKVPALMGEVDVIKAIQFLPGVQSTSEGSSGFSVRGGSADQNLILLDNTNIYNASHMFGFFSVFNNDVVKNAELYKGNLPIRFGGRLSSLLDVQIKDESPEKVKGIGGIGLISSRLTLEGPLGSKTSWLVSGRRSYADLFLKLSSDPDKRSESIYFYDINAKVSHRFSAKDKIYVNFYSGK